MAKGIRLHVWGDYALFTRPEMKAERVSYDVLTPSAARAIVSSIYWKPEIEWVIDRIHVLKPIRFTSVRRNEVGAVAVAPSREAIAGQLVDPIGLSIEDERQQRASLLLKDVGYIIEAHFNVVSPTLEKNGEKVDLATCEAKHISMFNRRAEAGQCFRRPYFGCREFPVSFRLLKDADPLPDSQLDIRDKDLGFMFHDFIYREDKKGTIVESHSGRKLTVDPRFFRAVMKDGIIEIPSIKGKEVVG